MVRRLLIIAFSVLSILAFLVKGVWAQIPTPTPTIALSLPGSSSLVMPLPGKNCGVTVDPNTRVSSFINRCCFNPPINVSLQNYNTPVLSSVFSLIENLMYPLFNPILLLQKQIVIDPCLPGASPSTPGNTSDPGCLCVSPQKPPLTALLDLCQNVAKGERSDCEACLQGGGADSMVGVWTGMGCIYTDLGNFIKKTVFGMFIGLAGMIALLCIIYSALSIQISGGNPEKIKKAQEMLTSCIMGLMLIICSICILKLIGVDILRIPRFQ